MVVSREEVIVKYLRATSLLNIMRLIVISLLLSRVRTQRSQNEYNILLTPLLVQRGEAP